MVAQAKSATKRAPKRKGVGTGADTQVATEKDVRVRVYRGHKETVNRVAMPEDGRFALTVSDDSTMRRWELGGGVKEGVIIHTDRGDDDNEALVSVALTADGSRAAAGNWDGEITLWDLAKKQAQMLRSWRAHKADTEVGGIAFLGQGDHLVSTCGEKDIRCWSFDAGEMMGRAAKGYGLQNVAVSADGSRIVGAGEGNGVVVWSDVPTDPGFNLTEEVSYMAPISVTGDGRHAWTGTESGQVACWNLDERRRVKVLEGHLEDVSAVAVTPDGRLVASGGFDKKVRLWEAETGQCLAVLRGHTDDINHIAITPDGRRIASVSDDKTLRVWDIPEEILAKVGTTKQRGYTNAKIVLVGDSGVGKSGLALRLWHDRWNETHSTHGMEIQRLLLPGLDKDPDMMREIWLWDLAGQPDYRLTHQLFMDQTALALLVFDPQDDKLFDTVGYWQKALAKVAGKHGAPGILVAARCDRPGLRWMVKEVADWAAERGLRGPVLTAARLKTHKGVRELRALMEELIPWDKMEFRSTPTVFSALKDAILKVRGKAEKKSGDGGAVVTPEELERRVRATVPKLTFASHDLGAVTGLLVGEGVLHALPYGGLVVLDPGWVNCYASTLVKMAGDDPHHLGQVPMAMIQPGKLPRGGMVEGNDGDAPATKGAAAKGTKKKKGDANREAEMDRRLELEDERQLLPALETLFIKRALAWKQDTIRGPMLVFPSYVRRPHPAPPQRPGSTVEYRFTGPLEEIYCTLVVQFHHCGLFSNADTKLYRQAVDFRTHGQKLVALTMREEGERGELEIYFDAGLDLELQATIQRFVDDHLKAKANEPKRLRHYFCPKCKEEVTDRKAVDTAKEKGRTKLTCNYCDPEDGAPGIIDLNDLLEQQMTNNAGEAGADQARRTAREGITEASMEGVMVGEVLTQVFSVDQIYRTVAQPDVGVDGVIEFRVKTGTRGASGQTYRVQLKSGRSHLTMRKDGAEIFALKAHYADHWTARGEPDVILIIRTEEEHTGAARLRFMNASKAIRAAQKANPGKKVTQLVFKGEDFTKEAVLRLRDERLGT